MAEPYFARRLKFVGDRRILFHQYVIPASSADAALYSHFSFRTFRFMLAVGVGRIGMLPGGQCLARLYDPVFGNVNTSTIATSKRAEFRATAGYARETECICAPWYRLPSG